MQLSPLKYSGGSDVEVEEVVGTVEEGKLVSTTQSNLLSLLAASCSWLEILIATSYTEFFFD